MNSYSKKLLGLGLLAVSLSTGLAIPLSYEIGTGSAVFANNDGSTGLEIETQLATGLSSVAFTLNDDQSYSFNFFKIWTDETTVNADDWNGKKITAKLDFDVPDLDAKVLGVTFSGTANNISGAVVLWWDPVFVDTGLRKFSVSLTDTYFDLGSGTSLGNSPAMIKATVKQISSSGGTSNVPDAGSTLMLLGSGLVAMTVLRRKRV